MPFRIGLIVPSSNTTMEPDFYRNLPADAEVYTARMFLEDVTVAGEEEMLDVHFPRALRDIATVHPDVVVFGCTSAGALRGNEYDALIVRRIQEEAGCPGVSVIKSVREALQARGRRVYLLTPYIDEVTERVAASLRDDGLEVVAAHGMGIKANTDIGRVTPEEIAEFARKHGDAARRQADCLFLSCTNLRAMEVRKALEEELGLPVETSNHATFVATMRHYHERVAARG
ncbi:MAG: aspartate/glutamate racemase family protein [Bacillota bacterium]|nr:Asp/Glu racemase [Bacillota bacterium]REJ34996.1 MAG: Asp/Glu racemase [Bacillota bacterium]